MNKLEKLDPSRFQRIARNEAATAFGGFDLYCAYGSCQGLGGNTETDYRADGHFLPF